MSTNRQKNSTLNVLAIFPLIASLSGCVVAPSETSNDATSDTQEGNQEQEKPDSESESEIIETAPTTATKLGSNLEISVHPLELINGDFLRLNLTLTNNSGSHYILQDALSDGDDPYSASNASLIDASSQTRHLSYDQENGSCFCSTADNGIDSGETVNLWVIFPAPPDDVEYMTVTTPITPPFLDVPILESSESIENDSISEPEITPLTMISDDIEHETGRQESEGDVSILLSSDVLFDTGSSDLTNDSQEIIAQVASEIDQSESSTVQVDGHADNTGSDAVNTPLSKERAEAVEEAISDRISRDGVSFETEGHGSADPIANNETEEGKKRNRRVTVTFEK
ncbi:OmpA family protein [Nocardiopsis kunsanensis]|uniref:OmpA family protein n=1 Tax=Nocardiopsis kunsanensis TaxID=141693 RepID=UPI0014613F15|nr:OmpA family protein [Nocardiopsis kunsanensis]